MRTFSRTPGIVITLLFVASACSAESADAGSRPAAETAAPATPAAESAATPAPLTDPEIAHVAVTANSIDVDMAHLAEDRTSNSAVLGFARTMITDHTAVNERAAALTQRLGVTPADNAVSRSLQSSADEARQRLAAANPQGRLVRPEEVAQAVVWLVRREASAMTGQAIAVAGGEVM